MKLFMKQVSSELDIPLPTLSRWRKKGIYSAEKNEGGGYSIDASELDRIRDYRIRGSSKTRSMKPKMELFGTDMKSPRETSLLEMKVKILEEGTEFYKKQLEQRDSIIEDYQDKLGNALDTIKTQTLLIEDRRNKEYEIKKEAKKDQSRVGWYVTAAVTILFFVISVYAFSSGHISLVSPMNVFSVIEPAVGR